MPASYANTSLRGRIGANALHARYDSKELTAPARAAFRNRFEREVDPAGELDPAERGRRARHALKEHMLRLSLASAKARKPSAASS